MARRAEDPVAKLRALVQGRQNRLLLCADSAGRRETLVQMLNEFGVTPDAQPDSIEAFLSSDAHFGIAAAPSAGFGLPGAGLAFLTENDLYPGLATTGRRGKRDQERASNVEAMVRDLSELRAGDPWCTPSTASAAITAWSTWTWAKARWSSCISNTPTAARCTCRCRSCT